MRSIETARQTMRIGFRIVGRATIRYASNRNTAETAYR
jgi:hypothetical protein